MTNLVLIGMPGCGKSTVGVLLAKVLGKAFIDTDVVLQAAEGKKLQPMIDEIGIDAFGAVELRVAQILSAEPIPKAKKLLKLQVDLGYEKRQVVSGIAKFYTPDQLVGKKVCLVTNLKPAKLCGVDSFGMILASGEEDVKVVFLDPTAKNGDRIH